MSLVSYHVLIPAIMHGNIMIADREIETVTLTENWKVGKYYSYTLNVYSDSVTFTTDILDNL